MSAVKSARDGVVSANCYTAAEIGEYEKIPVATMREFANETVRAITRRAREDGRELTEFCAFYNIYRNGLLTDKTVNAFLWHSKLQPFGHLFKLFLKRRKFDRSNNIQLCADFGIRKTQYDLYKQSGKLPILENKGKLPKYDVPAREGRSKVEFAGGGRLDIPQNAIYKRFKAGIDACNRRSKDKVTIPEIVLTALSEFMERREDIFAEGTVSIEETKLIKRTNERLYVDSDKALVEDIYKFLQRYNAGSPSPLTMNVFMEKAARALLERMPLPLVAPALAAEKAALDAGEQKKKR